LVTENEDGKELENRSYFAIGAVLGLAASIGLALLVFVAVNTASSVRDAISPPEHVPVAAATVDTTSPPDTTPPPTTDTPAADDSAGDDETDSGDTIDDAALIAVGKDLSVICLACHSTDGVDGLGPTWTGLFGSERSFEDGSTATADSAYILESIVDPEARVVDGFIKGIMPPSFGSTFSGDELDALVAYIGSL
jgi:mono/diheme cytochrome c family protein